MSTSRHCCIPKFRRLRCVRFEKEPCANTQPTATTHHRYRTCLPLAVKLQSGARPREARCPPCLMRAMEPVRPRVRHRCRSCLRYFYLRRQAVRATSQSALHGEGTLGRTLGPMCELSIQAHMKFVAYVAHECALLDNTAETESSMMIDCNSYLAQRFLQGRLHHGQLRLLLLYAGRAGQRLQGIQLRHLQGKRGARRAFVVLKSHGARVFLEAPVRRGCNKAYLAASPKDGHNTLIP